MTRLAAVLACLVLLGGITAVAARSQDDGGGGDRQQVFDVGDPQGIDSMSPLIGITVAAYEAWNIHYPTLTDKAAKDFSTIPGLAESWEESDGGRTWTYRLRPNLKWSDGEPLTAEDVAWTINTSRDEEWINHSATTVNLEAEATDDTTLVVTSKVPDPKLPTLDVYILPEHIWGDMTADEREKYDATEGVGGGPFVLEEFQKGQFARFRANPNYWGGRPEVDKVVLRKFNNPDAMVAALRTGELDAAQDLPGAAFDQLASEENIQTVEGFQGAMSEVAINGGDGLAEPHPALLDQTVRQAIGHAIDKETLVERVLNGHGEVAQTLSVSPDPRWTPEIPADQVFDFDLDQANSMLEEAGYRDADGDGIREMPGGGRPLNFTYYVRSDGETAPEIAEFVTGWLREIGIATTEKVADDSQLTTIVGKGEYDMFAWGWVPFVDPDPMLSYFTCGQVSDDPDNPTDYYNDANHCDREYDRLYEQQKVELDRDRRVEIVHEMLTRFQQSGTYHVLYTEPELQAYVKDRWEGFVRQPEGTGPVLYSNTSPSYARLTAASASGGGGDDGGGAGTIIAIGAVVVVAVGAGLLLARRRSTAYERE